MLRMAYKILNISSYFIDSKCQCLALCILYKYMAIICVRMLNIIK